MIRARANIAWALCGSALVHVALAVVPSGGGDRVPGRLATPVLHAQLAPAPHEARAELLVVDAPSPLLLPAAELLAALPPREALPPLPPAAPGAGRMGARGEGLVEAALLTDPLRVGPMMGRQLAEFPVEIGTPVRLNGRIAVHYPPAALAAGREDDVAVWIVVDAQGGVEEVQVTQGSPEFADPVVAAIRAARFEPATDARHAIRFPIALQFHFALPGAKPSATAAQPMDRVALQGPAPDAR